MAVKVMFRVHFRQKMSFLFGGSYVVKEVTPSFLVHIGKKKKEGSKVPVLFLTHMFCFY